MPPPNLQSEFAFRGPGVGGGGGGGRFFPCALRRCARRLRGVQRGTWPGQAVRMSPMSTSPRSAPRPHESRHAPWADIPLSHGDARSARGSDWATEHSIGGSRCAFPRCASLSDPPPHLPTKPSATEAWADHLLPPNSIATKRQLEYISKDSKVL